MTPRQPISLLLVQFEKFENGPMFPCELSFISVTSERFTYIKEHVFGSFPEEDDRFTMSTDRGDIAVVVVDVASTERGDLIVRIAFDWRASSCGFPWFVGAEFSNWLTANSFILIQHVIISDEEKAEERRIKELPFLEPRYPWD